MATHNGPARIMSGPSAEIPARWPTPKAIAKAIAAMMIPGQLKMRVVIGNGSGGAAGSSSRDPGACDGDGVVLRLQLSRSDRFAAGAPACQPLRLPGPLDRAGKR